MKITKVVLLAAIYLLLSSCQKELVDWVNQEPNTIEKAKELFSRWKLKKFTPSKNGLSLSFRTDSIGPDNYTKELDWNNAIYYYDAIKFQQVLEVPIHQNFIVEYFVPWSENRIWNDTVYRTNKRSLIITLDTLNEYNVAVCNIIPSEECIRNGCSVNSNNYKIKSSIFSGYVFYSDWHDEILEKYIFEDGKCTGKEIGLMYSDSLEQNETRFKAR